MSKPPLLVQLHPQCFTRWRALPILGPLLDDFVQWMHEDQEYTLGSVRIYLSSNTKVVQWLRARSIRRLGQLTLQHLKDAHGYFCPRHKPISAAVGVLERFLGACREVFPKGKPLPRLRLRSRLLTSRSICTTRTAWPRRPLPVIASGSTPSSSFCILSGAHRRCGNCSSVTLMPFCVSLHGRTTGLACNMSWPPCGLLLNGDMPKGSWLARFISTSGLRKAYKIFGLIDYLSGKFFYKGHTGKFNSDSYQTFLTEVLAQTTQHIILIQDGARYHTSKAMVDFFAQHPERLTVQQLPAYSPDFNPIEYLWRNIKKQATHMRYFPTFADLTRKVDDKLRYFAHTPKRILNLWANTASRWALNGLKSSVLSKIFF